MHANQRCTYWKNKFRIQQAISKWGKTCIVIIGDHLPLDPSLSKVLVLLLVLLAYWRSKNASGASDFRSVRIVLVH